MLSEWSMGDSFAIRSTEFLLSTRGSLQGFMGFFPAIAVLGWINKGFLHDALAIGHMPI
jgi:hypothetical protein